MKSGPAHIVVIGAGIGGLTAAALLRQAGYEVTVLEAHVYAGGSAGTFFHKSFRFDAGATLAGGFNEGGPHARLAEQLGLTWPVRSADPAWTVHLPDGQAVTQWADPGRWRAERERAFPGAAPARFWARQEMLADVAWDVSSRPFPWPPAGVRDLLTLARSLRPRTLKALPFLTKTVAAMAPADHALKLFIDAQLLIAAQTTSTAANALYGSAALDLPRRGVNHVQGGIGALAGQLVNWLRDHGADVHFRQQVEKIHVKSGRATAVTTKKGLTVECDWILANLTPWGLHKLLGADAPPRLAREIRTRPATWGAFTLYLGLDGAALDEGLPAGAAMHHQVIVDPTLPLGEGNSVFVSLSHPDDSGRAPAGQRTATLSTHTAVAPWWRLRHGADPEAYEARRSLYTDRLLAAAERAIPGLERATKLSLPATPVTFDFYTRRPQGMVGGFPQTSLFKVRGPQTGLANTLLVGDSIFPGQSTAGVTLGAMRVAALTRQRLPISSHLYRRSPTIVPKPR